jgi:hypothetical protein
MPTVSGTVTDKSGNVAAWSVPWTVGPSVLDLFAVAVFPTYTTKTYGQHAAVLTKLQALGTKNIRHLLMPGMSTAVQKFTTDARALGIWSWFTVGAPRQPFSASEKAQVKALLIGPLRGCVARVFSWNEANHLRSGSNDPPTAGWDTKQIAEHLWLWGMIQEVNADYDTDGTPHILVGTPGLWSGDIQKQYTDLNLIAPSIQGTYNFIGHHRYMRPESGTYDAEMIADLEDQASHFAAALGPGQQVCTESGLFTAPNYVGGAFPVTEQQQATIYPQLINWYVSRGWGFCAFELLDDPYDMTAPPSAGVRESSLGLIRTPALSSGTWVNKPAFSSVHDLLAA